MSASCDSKCQFSSLLMFEVIRLCSFILSHPLYFSYLLFFSPYLLKLISFLSPLFITTFLAFLAGFVHSESSQTRFTPILERLQFKKECPNINEMDDDLQIYEIVFGSPPSMAEVTENPSEFLEENPEKDNLSEPNLFLGSDEEVVEEEEEDKSVVEKKNSCVVMEEKRLENFLKILDEFERLAASNVEEIKKKKSEPTRGAKSDKVAEKQKSLLLRNGSEAAAAAACNNFNININNKECSSITMAKSHSQSQRLIDGKAESCRALDELSNYGSMRREREWKRTLACKLFEERHNGGNGGGGGEGMDSLWEAYEIDAMKGSEKVSKMKMKRERVKVARESSLEEDNEEMGGAQPCCLQALKLSAGKMNLGVGRPNLVKISKAIKGIGWLHKITKNSKKVHNNGDHRF